MWRAISNDCVIRPAISVEIVSRKSNNKTRQFQLRVNDTADAGIRLIARPAHKDLILTRLTFAELGLSERLLRPTPS